MGLGLGVGVIPSLLVCTFTLDFISWARGKGWGAIIYRQTWNEGSTSHIDVYIYASGGGGGGARSKSLKKASGAILFRPPPSDQKSFSKIGNFPSSHI